MRLTSMLAIAAALAASATALAAGPQYCAGDGPESVLRCYSAAYAARDSVAYALLLAPDYVSTDMSDSTTADFDYATSVKVVGRIFRTPEITSMALALGAPVTVEKGKAADTWVLRDVPATFRLDGTSIAGRPGPWTVRQTVSLWVRRVAAPVPHFVIFREELRRPPVK